MHLLARLLLLDAALRAYAVLLPHPHLAPTPLHHTISSNGKTPRPTSPPRFPKFPRQDDYSSECGELYGDAAGAIKECQSGSTCVSVDQITTNAFIFACCALTDQAVCESIATTCIDYLDNTLPSGQFTAQIDGGALLCGDIAPICLSAILYDVSTTADIYSMSYYCGASSTAIYLTEVSTVTEGTDSESVIYYTGTGTVLNGVGGPGVIATSSTGIVSPTVGPTSSASIPASSSGTQAPISDASIFTDLPTISHTTPLPSSTSSASSSPALATSSRAIIGGVIGGVAVLALLASICVISRKRQVRREAVWNPGEGKLRSGSGSYGRPPTELL